MVFRSLLYESLLINARKLMGWVSYRNAGTFGVFDDHKIVRDVTPYRPDTFGVVFVPVTLQRGVFSV